MRRVALVFACVAIASAIAGCSGSDKHYFKEGVGANLYSETAIPITDDVTSRTELQRRYIAEICEQAGLFPSQCEAGASDPRAWSQFVQAGMNDIDQRCDAYLVWLDNLRRAQAPTIKEISDAQSATTVIMSQSGVGSAPIAIVAAAFGFASNTFTNVTARLVLEVDRSTVQTIVLGRQKKYREDLFGTATTPAKAVIASRPAAIFALRSYLRLCMPMTIETEINSTIATFERGGAPALARSEPMISAKTVGVIRDVNAPLSRLAPRPSLPPQTHIGPFEQRGMSSKDFKTVLEILGCPGTDLGPADSDARKTLAKFLTDNGRTSSDRVTVGVFIDLRELKAQGKKGTCLKT